MFKEIAFNLTKQIVENNTKKNLKITITCTMERKESNGNLDVHLKPIVGDYTRLSICGESYINGREYSFGQMQSVLKEEFPDNKDVQRFVELWDRWHLNDMTAGTFAQEEFIRSYKKDHPDWMYDYTNACSLLKEAGLYSEEFPEGSIAKPDEHTSCSCSESAHRYKYGYKWLVEEIPEEVLLEIKSLVDKFNE